MSSISKELANPDIPVPADVQGNLIITSIDKIYNWSRRNSMWPMLFGLACCAIPSSRKNQLSTCARPSTACSPAPSVSAAAGCSVQQRRLVNMALNTSVRSR